MSCLPFHIYNNVHLCIQIYTDMFNYKTTTKFTEHKNTKISGATFSYSLCRYQDDESFLSSKICMFERDGSGDPIHCHNTEHLKFCENHECPDGYKCPKSYCIAIHMVCDGVKDCPESDDELHCDNIITKGLLRCRYDSIYVHPRHICDGIAHCIESYDDESVCEIYQCPQYCLCKGYTVMCIGSNEKEIKLPQQLKALFIRYTKHNIIRNNASFEYLQLLDLSNTTIFANGIPGQFFSNMTGLLILNLHNASITSLSNQSFVFLNNLVKITLSGNNIVTLHKHACLGLENIWILNLTYLMIRNLESESFHGLKSLMLLNISHNFISSLLNTTFSGLDNIDTLDIRFNPITTIDGRQIHLVRFYYTSFLYTTPLKRDTYIKIHMDDGAICCYVPHKVKCKLQEQDYKRLHCEMLISRPSYMMVYFLYAVFFLLFGVIVFYVQLRKESYNGQLPVMLYLAVKDILLACMMLLLLSVHFVYNHNYALHRNTISQHFICKLHGFLTVYVQVMVKNGTMIMCLIHYRIIVHSMTKIPYSICRITKLLSLISIVEMTLIISWTYYSDTKSIFLCSPFSLHTTVYSEVVNIILIALYLLYNCFSLLVVTFAYVYIYYNVKKRESNLGAMNKSTMKKKTSSTLRVKFGTTLLTHYLHFLEQLVVLLSPVLVSDYNDEVSVLMFYSFAFSCSTLYIFTYDKQHMLLLFIGLWKNMYKPSSAEPLSN